MRLFLITTSLLETVRTLLWNLFRRLSTQALVLSMFLVLSATKSTLVFALPTVMDFESLRVESEEQVFIHGTSYSEDGFTLSVTCCEPFAGEQSTDLRTSGTLAAIYPGSTAMFGGKSNTLITLTASDGGLFDLLSIDLAVLPGTELIEGELVPINTGDPQVITFEGVNVKGEILTQTFTHTNFLNLTTYYFNDFKHLTSVSWFQGPGDPYTHQFDNITLNNKSHNVPEPASLALLVLGLAGISIARRIKS